MVNWVNSVTMSESIFVCSNERGGKKKWQIFTPTKWAWRVVPAHHQPCCTVQRRPPHRNRPFRRGPITHAFGDPVYIPFPALLGVPAHRVPLLHNNIFFFSLKPLILPSGARYSSGASPILQRDNVLLIHACKGFMPNQSTRPTMP